MMIFTVSGENWLIINGFGGRIGFLPPYCVIELARKWRVRVMSKWSTFSTMGIWLVLNGVASVIRKRSDEDGNGGQIGFGCDVIWWESDERGLG